MTAAPLILIVEDDPSVVELERVLLEDEGYQVITAKDGLEGLLKAEFRHPALVVLDLMMPNVDGARMYEELRADPRISETPVLIVTGMAEAHELFDDLVGAENVIIKPFAMEDLVARVAGLAGPPGDRGDHGAPGGRP